MKVEEIMALSGLELAATVASFMANNVVQSPREIVSAKPPACYRDAQDSRGLVCWQAGGSLGKFRPDQSLDDMARVRSFVSGLDRHGDFLSALWLLSDDYPDGWALLDASATTQARAFVLMMDR